MNPAQQLLDVLIKSAEGTRKPGFTTGGVSFSLNNAADEITGTFTIPVQIQAGSNGELVAEPKDFLNFAE